jgi:hypothetical protein
MNVTILCPYCEVQGIFNIGVIPTMLNVPYYNVPKCPNCCLPVVIETEREVTHTPLKVEGIKPDIPTMEENESDVEEALETSEFEPEMLVTCNKIEKFSPRGVPESEPAQFHCGECGFIYPLSMKGNGGSVCQACEADTPVQPDEQTGPDYTQLPGSKTVSYHIKKDIVCLKYKDSCCGGYTFDIIWGIIDSPKSTWTRQCDATVEGEKNAIQKATALHQFCKAIDRGDVTLPEEI